MHITMAGDHELRLHAWQVINPVEAVSPLIGKQVPHVMDAVTPIGQGIDVMSYGTDVVATSPYNSNGLFDIIGPLLLAPTVATCLLTLTTRCY
jgi:hypothetical protein